VAKTEPNEKLYSRQPEIYIEEGLPKHLSDRLWDGRLRAEYPVLWAETLPAPADKFSS